MMETFAVQLEPVERAVLGQIEFDVLRCVDHVEVERNANLAVQLVQSLVKRSAIPEHRRYFTDPAYNVGGRGSSNQQIFERNGCRGTDILRHPHFLPYLRYFVLGADLPDDVRDAFKAEVEACGMVTSSDVVPLGKKAKALTRRYGLKPHEARDEFFKLALDCGLAPHTAVFIRDAVRTVR